MTRKSLNFCLVVGLLTLILLSNLSPSRAAIHNDPQLAVDAEKINSYLQKVMKDTPIPGLALGVVSGDQIIYLKGYGSAGPDGRLVTPQTPFIIGSVTKSFTALAVMQLVEAGQIDLDAPVVRYLPWFHTADSKASSSITVRRLLNQTSGFSTYQGRLGFNETDTSSSALEKGVRQFNHSHAGASAWPGLRIFQCQLHHPGINCPDGVGPIL